MPPSEPLPFSQAWRSIRNGLAAVLVISGVLALALDSAAAAWVAVASLGLAAAAQIAIAVIAYRRTMRRPWPQVAPLPDDDWDD